MELDDCAFPLLADVVCTDDADTAFGDADVALLVGAMPRKAGHGALRPAVAPTAASSSRRARRCRAAPSRDVKVLVVGNPANTNALIAQRNADGPRPRPLHGDDPSRPQPGRHASSPHKLGAPVTDVKQMTIWGNHSTTQYPDLFHCEVGRRRTPTRPSATTTWVDGTFIPTVAKRGAAIIEARGVSSAASAANAAVDHIRSWALGTPDGDWVSMAHPVRRQLRRAGGHDLQLPGARARGGEYSIVQGLDIDDYSRGKIDASAAELVDEREAVQELGLV